MLRLVRLLLMASVTAALGAGAVANAAPAKTRDSGAKKLWSTFPLTPRGAEPETGRGKTSPTRIRKQKRPIVQARPQLESALGTERGHGWSIPTTLVLLGLFAGTSLVVVAAGVWESEGGDTPRLLRWLARKQTNEVDDRSAESRPASTTSVLSVSAPSAGTPPSHEPPASERVASDLAQFGERVAAVLATADASARKLRADAERDANEIREEAGRIAANIRITAQRDADAQALEIVSSAEKYASKLSQAATERRRTLVAEIAAARSRLREMKDSMRAVAALLERAVGDAGASDEVIETERAEDQNDSVEDSLPHTLVAAVVDKKRPMRSTS
jgi:hypothetical protein